MPTTEVETLQKQRDEWQQKWFADREEVKQLREQVKRLKPFQDAYDDAMGAGELIRQSLRAEKAEAALTVARQQIETVCAIALTHLKQCVHFIPISPLQGEYARDDTRQAMDDIAVIAAQARLTPAPPTEKTPTA